MIILSLTPPPPPPPSHWNLSLCCLRMNWEIPHLRQHSGTQVPACVCENSINQLSLASTYLKTFLL